MAGTKIKAHIDTLAFITEVKQRRAIWDVNCQDYKMPHKKHDAWLAVVKAMTPNYDELSEGERANIGKTLQCRWRAVRDSFVRDFKKKDGRKYLYRNDLMFLNEIYNYYDDETLSDSGDFSRLKTAKKSANRSWKNDDVTVENAWLSDDEERKGKSETDACVENAWESEDEIPVQQKKARNTIEYVEAPAINTSSIPTYPLEDEDRSFFDSLLPAVRSFDLDQKLEFRCGVLKLVKTIRNTEVQKIKLSPGSDYDKF